MQSKKTRWMALALGLTLPVAYACNGDDDYDGDDDGNNNSSSSSSSTSSSSSGGLDASLSNDADPGDASGDAAVALSDAEIGGVLATVNNGEIAQGQLAQEQAQSADAKAFGADMVQMHTAAQTRQDAVFEALGVTPADSPTSAQLKAKADAATAQLQATSGAAFDLAYLQGQATMHGEVLQMIDQVLVPNATAASLQAELQTARMEVSMHQQRAQELLASLAGDAGSADGGNDAGDAAP